MHYSIYFPPQVHAPHSCQAFTQRRCWVHLQGSVISVSRLDSRYWYTKRGDLLEPAMVLLSWHENPVFDRHKYHVPNPAQKLCRRMSIFTQGLLTNRAISSAYASRTPEELPRVFTFTEELSLPGKPFELDILCCNSGRCSGTTGAELPYVPPMKCLPRPFSLPRFQSKANTFPTHESAKLAMLSRRDTQVNVRRALSTARLLIIDPTLRLTLESCLPQSWHPS